MTREDTIKPMSIYEKKKVLDIFLEMCTRNGAKIEVDKRTYSTTIRAIWIKSINCGCIISATFRMGEVENIMIVHDGYKHSINFRFCDNTKYLI